VEYLNFSWVLPGSLAGSQGPTSRSHLEFLRLNDIRAIVRMEERTISGEAMELVDLYEPVPDFTAPRLDQLEGMVLFIEEQLQKWARPVVVTCQAGLGRTGTVLACYLVHAGYSPGDAVGRVRELRPWSIQTRDQEDAVHRYADVLKSREGESGRQPPEARGEP
jgi:atypical dual specificity phosphatase